MSGPRQPPAWRDRDIAFLKPKTALSGHQLRAIAHIPDEVACHPVIILKLSLDGSRAMVTTVSAYGSRHGSTHMPWQARSRKDHVFRAFVGTPRPREQRPCPFLALEPGCGAFAYPDRSWVNAKTVWCVPVSSLGAYRKAQTTSGRRCLKITAASLADLKLHIEEVSPQFKSELANFIET